jgi:hypothetical protein
MSIVNKGRRVVRLFEHDAELAEMEVREGRFQRSMAAIAAFSAIVSGFEAYVQHQRGAFNHWLMWTPVWLTPPAVIAAAVTIFSKNAGRMLLPIVSLVSLADGIVGFVYHLKGIKNLPGGYKLGQYNIVMGPPVFAPLLTCIVGVLGMLAGLLRRETPDPIRADLASALRKLIMCEEPESALERLATRVALGRFQKYMALASAFFSVLAGGEAYFEHLRGSYNERVMWTPVWITPFMVAAAFAAAFSERAARTVLPIASAASLLDGLLGFFLHLQGIKRMPGGFANLRFNITMGPPLFAPLLLSSVGLLGFLATLLRRKARS